MKAQGVVSATGQTQNLEKLKISIFEGGGPGSCANFWTVSPLGGPLLRVILNINRGAEGG